MPRLTHKINANEFDAIFDVQFDEDDASLHVTRTTLDSGSGVPTQIAEFIGVLDEQDARACLRQLFTPSIADQLTIQRV